MLILDLHLGSLVLAAALIAMVYFRISFSRTMEGIGCWSWIFTSFFGSFSRTAEDADLGSFFCELVSGGPYCAGSDGGKREVRC